MSSIIVNRTMKRPGLIDGSRAFRIELNEKGLYLINLGRCTTDIQYHADAISSYLAGKIIKVIDRKFEKNIQAKEAQIESQGIDSLLADKKSHILRREEVERFEVIPRQNHTVTLKIKGPGVNLTVHAHQGYLRMLEMMQLELKGN